MKKVISFIVFVLISTIAFAQESAKVNVIAPKEYAKEIKKDKVQLVDVRTPEEFSEGHIEGAKNIDFFSEDFAKSFEKLDKAKPVYIYCRSGNRSAKAAVKLAEMGFTTIIDLQGGYKAWVSDKE